jgi:phenylacetate-CoA ligase
MSLTHQLFLQRLREIEQYDAVAFDTYRGPLLATLVDHAWREAQAYRDAFSRLIDRDGFALESWSRLPVLRALDLKANLAAFQERTQRPPPYHAEDVAPSPALPIRRRSIMSSIAEACERELVYEMWGLDLPGTLAILHPDHPALATGRGWSITFTRNAWVAGPCDATADEQLQWLSATGARTLRTTASIAKALAAAAGSGDSIKLQSVVIADLELAPGLEAEIAAAFGACLRHLIEWPTLGILAASRDGASYVVPAASNVFEVVDESGRPVASGQAGELLVSPLYEFATPLLRFATGLAAVAPAEPRTILGVRELAGVKARASR